MTNSGFGQNGQQDGQNNGFGQNDGFSQDQGGFQNPDQGGGFGMGQWQDGNGPDPSQPAPGQDPNIWGDPEPVAPWQPEPAPVAQEPWTPVEEEEPVYEPVVNTSSYSEAPEDEAPFEDPPQLALGEDEVRLPWLEGDEDEDEEPSGMSQGLILALLGVAALALIGGAIFWIARDRPDENLVADGGVITAPDGPYKTRPENPGGEVVAGTGDTSFAVAEGQTRPAQIEAGKDKPAADANTRPGFASVADKPAASATSDAPAPAKGPGVQVGAYSSRDAAEKGWATLQQRYGAVLSGIQHRVLEGKADIGTVYRLQALPGDMAAARSLSSKLEAVGVESSIKP